MCSTSGSGGPSLDDFPYTKYLCSYIPYAVLRSSKEIKKIFYKRVYLWKGVGSTVYIGSNLESKLLDYFVQFGRLRKIEKGQNQLNNEKSMGRPN